MMLKQKEIRDMAGDELVVTLGDCQRELFTLKNKHTKQQRLDKTHLIKEKRKEIARIKTELHTRNRAEASA